MKWRIILQLNHRAGERDGLLYQLNNVLSMAGEKGKQELNINCKSAARRQSHEALLADDAAW